MSSKRKNLQKVWFREARHVEEIVADGELDSLDKDLWRKNRERMKTVSVALVLCLNIGVDPPDVSRTVNGPRKHAWVEPVVCSPQKSAQKIALNLQTNYEKLQSKARYRTAIDPTVECVKKLAQSLRRNAKEERVLFHFNGHGVPRPTEAGEIWVFNKNITQYIPLSLYDLQTWTGSPSVYVWDCHSAGTILNMFLRFEEQHRTSRLPDELGSNEDTIQLGACEAGELLPQHPNLPADLFTSCLTTPIQTSILCYIIKTGEKDKYSDDVFDDIPGHLTDRRTMLGELNWIFTAITDTIAWNALSAESFQRLFRQDQLTASLFRSFLLAERIMAEYNCHVVSQPALPSVLSHPLWDYWEYTIDVFLNNISQLNTCKDNVYHLSRNEFFNKSFLRHNWLVDSMPSAQSVEQYNSSFFSDHLKAFEIWLRFSVTTTKPPDELPIILQVLLSQVHRVHGLELWAKFVDIGAWAVGAALSVGIFPYVLKLLQSNSKDLRGPLAFIWAKILWVDPARQQELVKENGYFYFIQILNDSHTTPRMKIVPAYVMATIIHNQYRPAQEKLIDSEYMTLCMELLLSPEVVKCKLLCQWLLIGLGRLWVEYDKARWHAVRNLAYERVIEFLNDEIPEVRAAAVFALGCFVRNHSVNNEHATTIDNEVCDKICDICTYDGSVLVRAELAVAIQWYIVDFETRFTELYARLDKKATENEPFENNDITNSHVAQFGKHTEVFSKETTEQMFSHLRFLEKKTFNEGAFERMWLSLLRLSFDSFPHVSTMARRLINHIRDRSRVDRINKMKRLSESQSNSPNTSLKSDGITSNGRSVKFVIGSPVSAQSEASAQQLRNCTSINEMVSLGVLQTPGNQFTPKRSIYGSQSGRYAKVINDPVDKPVEQLVATQFVEWCSKSFQQPIFKTIYEEVSTSTLNSLVDGSCPFTQTNPTDWALHTHEGLIQKSTADVEDFKKEKIKCETLHFECMANRTVTSLTWSVLRPLMVTCDGETAHIYNLTEEHAMSPIKTHFTASDEPILNDCVTDMMIANGLTHEVILTGSRNGVLKVWDPDFCDHGHGVGEKTKLVTAAHLISNRSRIARNKMENNQTLYSWDQPCGRVVCSGNVRFCRIWDAWSEKSCCDIFFRNKNLTVTSLSAELTNNLVCLGFNNGTVSVYDVRLPSKEGEVLRAHDFNSSVLGTSIAFGRTNIVAGSKDGDFKAWEPRMYQDPLVEFSIFDRNFLPPTSRSTAASNASLKNLSSPFVYKIDIQPTGQLVSCAISNGSVYLFDVFGKKCLTQLKYVSQAVSTATPTALRFHADKVLLGVANSTNQVYVYGSSDF